MDSITETMHEKNIYCKRVFCVQSFEINVKIIRKDCQIDPLR